MIDTDKLDKECWSLDVTIANMLLPKLLYYKNFVLPNTFGIPSDFYDDKWEIMYWEEWEEAVDDMVWAFTYASRGYEWYDYEGEFETICHDDGYFELKTDEELWAKYVAARIKETARFEHGMRVFAKHFRDLWD